jgi:hypothetical protein
MSCSKISLWSPKGSTAQYMLALTVDPFGLWVMDHKLRLEQIFHSEFAITASLAVRCNNTQIGGKGALIPNSINTGNSIMIKSLFYHYRY